MNNCEILYTRQTNQEHQSYKDVLGPIVILGPTGVGKSDIALELATKLDGEIVNADSAQMYTSLTIGTAKPDYKISKIPHHCFDILDEPVHYDVMQYRKKLIATVRSIQQQKKVPIIVGGSGFYIKSLLYPPLPALSSFNVTKHSDYRLSHKSYDDQSSQKEKTADLDKISWQNLHAIDPVRATQIHPNDTYRIKRALGIWHTYGVKPSEFKPVFDPWTDMIIVWATCDRTSLYERINRRVVTMIDTGWIEEVQALRNTPWQAFLRKKKIIGYDEILKYLDLSPAMRDQKKLIEQIQRKTRNYAKAQEIFWKSFKIQLIESLEHYQGAHRIIITVCNLPSPKATCQAETAMKDNGVTSLTLTTHDLYINQLLQIYSDRKPS